MEAWSEVVHREPRRNDNTQRGRELVSTHPTPSIWIGQDGVTAARV